MIIPKISLALPIFPVHEKNEVRETENFTIIYQKPLAGAVPLIAEYCEEAYGVLTRVFNWIPSEKTTLLLQDGFDTHNGWATSVPHNTVTLYIAGPMPGTSIFQDGNYIKRTIYHELTHVISTDMRLGYSKYLSMVFGKVEPTDLISTGLFLFTSSPVELSPRWFLEGMAIWSETEFCPPGRGRSTYADMIFRCAVQEDNLLPYSKWYLDIPYWPYGDGAYLYGMKFFQHLYENNVRDNPVGMETQNLAESFLFNLDSATKKTTGKYTYELAEEMMAKEILDQKKKLNHLNNYTPTEIKRRTATEISAYHPVFVKDRIYFLGMEAEKRDTLYAYDLQTKETEKITNTTSTASIGSMTASRNGRYLYYTVLEVQKNEDLWSEIRRYDTSEGDDTLVTGQGRYLSIDLSPDGTKMVAVSQRSGKSSLLLLDLNGDGDISKEKQLIEKPFFHMLSTPRFSPDGNRIAFIETFIDGYALKVWNLGTGAEKTIYYSKKQLLTPSWHPTKDLLIFSSDINGVYNICAIETDGNSQPFFLTHVTGGLFSPVLSPDAKKIAAISFDSKGPHLTLIPYPVIGFSITALPQINPSWKDGKISRFLKRIGERDIEKPERKNEINITNAKPYNSFMGIRPDYWSPWVGFDSSGVRAGVGASFSDPTGYQDLKISAGYEFEYDSKLGAIYYTYKGLYPQIHVYAAADQEYYPDLLLDQNSGRLFDYAEEIYRAGVAVEFPYTKVDRQIDLRVGYEYTNRDVVDEVASDYQFRQLTVYPTEEDQGDLWARILYFDGTEFKSSCSVEDGRYISFAASVSDETLGGGYFRKLFTSEWREYISMPWLENHVFLLTGFYGFGDGDKIAQGYFGLGGGLSDSSLSSDSFGISRTQGIRGYATNYQTGEQVTKAMASYRFPVVNFFKGYGNRFPSYFKQIHVEVFYAGGRTWDEIGNGDDLKWINALGTEANLSMTLFRYVKFAPGLGVVYVPDKVIQDEDDSEVNVYISVKGWVSF